MRQFVGMDRTPGSINICPDHLDIEVECKACGKTWEGGFNMKLYRPYAAGVDRRLGEEAEMRLPWKEGGQAGIRLLREWGIDEHRGSHAGAGREHHRGSSVGHEDADSIRRTKWGCYGFEERKAIMLFA
ncbi:hypothetical protein HGP14_23830 [Rhizobium sp. P32RR-XVIII]|uniref:hypothetical protein n=1 Tax=Rhizobium sp. P32RR-XVIII TaxID=2726738 RepID=UPI001456B67B|nr:hypothetical protein [Rhizobium sp. P32RR-XVIII]NLS06346.1 hypothetical protein [Rhizobium sp. P32RR-XVIII]